MPILQAILITRDTSGNVHVAAALDLIMVLNERPAAADALADWLCHRIGDCFATRVPSDATE